jgi:DNA modification methylase
MAGERAALMATDPPYGVSLDGGWRERRGVNAPGQDTQKDRLAGDARTDWAEAFSISGAPVAYVWHGGLYAVEAAQALARAGYEIRAQIVWVKPHGFISRGHYQWRHEPCWYAVKKGSTANWNAGRDQDTVWEHASPRAAQTAKTDDDPKADHPTQKPVALWDAPIHNHTRAGDVVYEPFSGSGTQIIAAEKTGRRCRAIEIAPAYVDVAVERWRRHTGKVPRREADR